MVKQSHTFHIPVMGTGFTIDTPLRVAHLGISSVISLVDDVLIEQVRQYHCRNLNKPYERISGSEPDARARRITAYLNLIHGLVQDRVQALQASPFEPGSDITLYFELLPESSLKTAYYEMMRLSDGPKKRVRQEKLRRLAVPGKSDVNIMTKLDCDAFRNGEKLPHEFSDALSALRGYANSHLSSSIVFSAGINQHLYSYAAEFEDFFPDAAGEFKKSIILKVSDFRSALIQGKFLAKRGLWVSEYRIESGLNCGGHAFATQGLLLGPVLEEFRRQKPELLETLGKIYAKALRDSGRPIPGEALQTKITVQGGIGTAAENNLLLQYYDIDGTGWGTPFLLVPEATNVDQAHLDKLMAAQNGDVYLSASSPMGVPFWNLRTSASEEARRRRISEHKPGSPCFKHYVTLNTDYTDQPVCLASSAYVKRRLDYLAGENLPAERLAELRKSVLEKSCICHDLAGGATVKYDIDPKATPSICCGPNIRYFSDVASLREMVDHIYGRFSLLKNTNRPHMFIQELRLYIDELGREIKSYSQEISLHQVGWIETFKKNLLSGIEYYQGLARQFLEDQCEQFLNDLTVMQQEIERLRLTPEEAH